MRKMKFEEFYEAHSAEMVECGKRTPSGAEETLPFDIKMPNIEIDDKKDARIVITDEFKKYFDTNEYRQIYANLRNVFTIQFVDNILTASNIVMSYTKKAANFCVVNITNGVLLKFASGFTPFNNTSSQVSEWIKNKISKIGDINGIDVYVDSSLWGSNGTVLVGHYDENDENNLTVEKIVTFNCQY